MSVLAVPKILRERLTDAGVDEFIAIVKGIEDDARKDSLVITEEITKLRVEMAEKFAQLEIKMETRMAQLETMMTSFKTEIIKWMFLFWLGQIVVVAGLIKFLK